MTKDEMRAGLLAGRRLTQEEWAAPAEIRAIDELVAEGFATATPWQYSDGFQCQRRTIVGKRRQIDPQAVRQPERYDGCD